MATAEQPTEKVDKKEGGNTEEKKDTSEEAVKVDKKEEAAEKVDKQEEKRGTEEKDKSEEAEKAEGDAEAKETGEKKEAAVGEKKASSEVDSGDVPNSGGPSSSSTDPSGKPDGIQPSGASDGVGEGALAERLGNRPEDTSALVAPPPTLTVRCAFCTADVPTDKARLLGGARIDPYWKCHKCIRVELAFGRCFGSLRWLRSQEREDAREIYSTCAELDPERIKTYIVAKQEEAEEQLLRTRNRRVWKPLSYWVAQGYQEAGVKNCGPNDVREDKRWGKVYAVDEDCEDNEKIQSAKQSLSKVSKARKPGGAPALELPSASDGRLALSAGADGPRDPPALRPAGKKATTKPTVQQALDAVADESSDSDCAKSKGKKDSDDESSDASEKSDASKKSDEDSASEKSDEDSDQSSSDSDAKKKKKKTSKKDKKSKSKKDTKKSSKKKKQSSSGSSSSSSGAKKKKNNKKDKKNKSKKDTKDAKDSKSKKRPAATKEEKAAVRRQLKTVKALSLKLEKAFGRTDIDFVPENVQKPARKAQKKLDKLAAAMDDFVNGSGEHDAAWANLQNVLAPFVVLHKNLVAFLATAARMKR